MNKISKTIRIITSTGSDGHRVPLPAGVTIVPTVKQTSVPQSMSEEYLSLPLLFSRGLPTSLNKFDERGLEVFLVYLIESAAALAGRNVWRIPCWWSTNIPYNPTRFTHSIANRIEVMRSLVISCYTYFGLTSYLEVSQYLSDESRSLLRFRHQADGLVVISHIRSGRKVTVKGENLTYDIGTLAAEKGTNEHPVITILDSDDEYLLKEESTSVDDDDCVVTHVERLSPNKLSALRKKYLIPKKKDYSLLNKNKPSSSLTSNEPGPSNFQLETPKPLTTTEYPVIELTDSEDELFITHEDPCFSSTVLLNKQKTSPVKQNYLELPPKQKDLITKSHSEFRKKSSKSRRRKQNHSYREWKYSSDESQESDEPEEKQLILSEVNQSTFLEALGMAKKNSSSEPPRSKVISRSHTQQKSRSRKNCFVKLPYNYLSRVSICDIQKLIAMKLVTPTALPKVPTSFRPGHLKGTTTEKWTVYKSMALTSSGPFVLLHRIK